MRGKQHAARRRARTVLDGAARAYVEKRIPLGRIGACALVSLAMAPSAAQAIVFNLTFDPSVTAAQQTAVNYAALSLSNLYNDPITLNMTVTSVAGTGTLGMSSTSQSIVAR